MSYNLYRFNKFCGIYLICNTITGQMYVGQSKNIGVRWMQHMANSINTKKGEFLYNAIRQYGIENFSFQILELCEKEKLNERERYWISYFNSNIDGYNQTIGNK